MRQKPRGKPFAKGDKRCGRPKGVPNKCTQEVRAWARAIMEDPTVQANMLKQAQEGRLAPGIVNELLHYAYGKPKDTIEHTGLDGATISQVVRVIMNAKPED